MSFKIIMTTSVTRPCFTTEHHTCKTKIDFWSETGLVLRSTVSDNITDCPCLQSRADSSANIGRWPVILAGHALNTDDHIATQLTDVEKIAAYLNLPPISHITCTRAWCQMIAVHVSGQGALFCLAGDVFTDQRNCRKPNYKCLATCLFRTNADKKQK